MTLLTCSSTITQVIKILTSTNVNMYCLIFETHWQEEVSTATADRAEDTRVYPLVPVWITIRLSLDRSWNAVHWLWEVRN